MQAVRSKWSPVYLLDTDVLSNLLRRTPSTRLIRKLASIPVERQFTSSITLGELVYGALRLKSLGPRLLEELENRLLPNLPVLPFDEPAARHYGKIKAALEARGVLIGDADLRIASIALFRGLTVVTGNVRHFERVPDLGVENWLV